MRVLIEIAVGVGLAAMAAPYVLLLLMFFDEIKAQFDGWIADRRVKQ